MTKRKVAAWLLATVMMVQSCVCAFADDSIVIKDVSIVSEQKVEDISEEVEVRVGTSAYNKCFGEQLSGLSRELYNAFAANYVKNKKTGNYKYTFQTPLTFESKVDENKNIVQNEAYKNTMMKIAIAMQNAIDALKVDYPEIYWINDVRYATDAGASGTVEKCTVTVRGVTILPSEIYVGAAAKHSAYNDAVTKAVSSIKSSMGSASSRAFKVKYIHDYICKKAYYRVADETRIHSSEPLFLGDGGVVCEGYAKAFKVLCEKFGIPCACISGVAYNKSGQSEQHMWNYVQMDDGKWYLVDLTWDDQTKGIVYDYFLVGKNSKGFSNLIAKERKEYPDFSLSGYEHFVYPVLSDSAYAGRNNVLNANRVIKTTKISGLKKSITIKKGAKTTLKPKLTPSNSTQKITYVSSNKKIATVSSKGVVVGKGKGKAKITVKSGTKSFVVTVTVK